jgi:hypothetical protein
MRIEVAVFADATVVEMIAPSIPALSCQENDGLDKEGGVNGDMAAVGVVTNVPSLAIPRVQKLLFESSRNSG